MSIKTRIVKYQVSLVRESAKTYPIGEPVVNSLDFEKTIRQVFRPDEYPGEIVGMFCLDSANKIIGAHVIGQGVCNQAAVYPADVARRAILNNSAAVVMFHSHPGGCLEPSSADWLITKRLQTILTALDMPLLDHLILTEGPDGKCVSLRSLAKW